MYKFAYLMIVAVFFSCTTTKPKVDLLVKNATVYTVNNTFDSAEAFVVNKGKIVEVAPLAVLLTKYTPENSYDAQGKTIVPGLIDAHAHFYGLGLSKHQVDLVGTKSFDEVLERLKTFQKKYNKTYITGRGWDQNDWEDKSFPTNEKLDKLFPDTPVAITRIDGHAMLVNSVALKQAGILPTTIVPGGKVVLKNGKPTGVLIDKAMDLVQATIPEPTLEEKKHALLTAQEICFKNGLTTVDDAGLDDEIIQLIEELQQEDKLKIRLYAMLSYSPNNLFKYLPNGPKKTDKLHVRSVKFYADGALGSRGAALIEPYHDDPGNKGLLMLKPNQFKAMALRIKEAGFQMNTHAIGDAANRMVLKTYDEVLKDTQNARWRIEHAQVVAPEDFKYFSNNCIPSVQPTHATSDMYWAEDRLGKNRLKGAYAYKSLLKQAGVIALGTDFPIEQVNPILTFYAAVSRKDLNGYPKEGFLKEEALTREEALKGMTIWAAYANFEENEKGSIEPQKWADFTVLDTDIMQVPEEKIPQTKVVATFVAGKQVF